MVRFLIVGSILYFILLPCRETARAAAIEAQKIVIFGIDNVFYNEVHPNFFEYLYFYPRDGKQKKIALDGSFMLIGTQPGTIAYACNPQDRGYALFDSQRSRIYNLKCIDKDKTGIITNNLHYLTSFTREKDVFIFNSVLHATSRISLSWDKGMQEIMKETIEKNKNVPDETWERFEDIRLELKPGSCRVVGYTVKLKVTYKDGKDSYSQQKMSDHSTCVIR